MTTRPPSLARLLCLTLVVFALERSAFAQSGVLVYVPNAGDGTVSAYVTDGSGVLVPSTPATIAVGAAPVAVAIRPDQAFAYVSNQDDHSISVVATASGTVVQTIAGPARYAKGIAVSPDGKTVYQGIQGVPSVVQVYSADVSTGQLTASATISLPNPYGLAVSPDGSRLYVTNDLPDSLSVIDTATNAVVESIPVGSVPAGV